ncbi:MAG: AAA family ATPase, partial [Clostridiales bacterium]|nr:AAA family ATPase [Clostridiales bacterium]
MDKIFLESASFKELIKSKALYVDKTLFVKHFLEAEGTAIQVSRPAKWGKTLNLDMLAEYLDVKKDSGDLFDGLAISQWPGFEKHLNKYPVVRLDLKNLKIEDYKIAIRNMLCECIEKYIPEEKMTPKVKSFYFRPAGTDCSNLQSLA